MDPLLCFHCEWRGLFFCAQSAQKKQNLINEIMSEKRYKDTLKGTLPSNNLVT